jgi:hypothetical protein
VRSIILSLFAGCLALTTAGCDRHVDLGAIGDGGASLLWRGGFEGGDLSEWTSDGNGGARVENAPAAFAVTGGVVHRGRYAGAAAIAPVLGMDSLNYLYRAEPSPPEAYYSAWFYIPSPVTVGQWLSLHHFRGSAAGSPDDLTGIWDVNLYELPGGGLAAQLGDFISSFNLRQTAPIPVPLDAWVHFEVYFGKAADATGRVSVWQDGQLILDRPDVVTARSPLVIWEVGGGTDNVTPSPATVYVDDAAISLVRLGPTAN